MKKNIKDDVLQLIPDQAQSYGLPPIELLPADLHEAHQAAVDTAARWAAAREERRRLERLVATGDQDHRAALRDASLAGTDPSDVPDQRPRLRADLAAAVDLERGCEEAARVRRYQILAAIVDRRDDVLAQISVPFAAAQDRADKALIELVAAVDDTTRAAGLVAWIHGLAPGKVRSENGPRKWRKDVSFADRRGRKYDIDLDAAMTVVEGVARVRDRLDADLARADAIAARQRGERQGDRVPDDHVAVGG